ncbi:hypothetical protein, partial [Candidatus Amarobacter glycogenicus]|uniref:hypothetical protein n=1 Tax=Candidatus Amarobacter glycogenicus TaxID=3140699 RepID=UPI0031CC989C
MEPTEFLISGYKVRHDGHNWIIESPSRGPTAKRARHISTLRSLGITVRAPGAAQRLYREELKGKGQQNMKGMADLIILPRWRTSWRKRSSPRSLGGAAMTTPL